jgi:hypothetical protein
MSVGYAGTPVSSAIYRVRGLPEPMNMKLCRTYLIGSGLSDWL